MLCSFVQNCMRYLYRCKKGGILRSKVRNTREFNDIALSSGSDVVFVQGLRDSADNACCASEFMRYSHGVTERRTGESKTSVAAFSPRGAYICSRVSQKTATAWKTTGRVQILLRAERIDFSLPRTKACIIYLRFIARIYRTV